MISINNLTTLTSPFSVFKGKGFVYPATVETCFAGREKTVNLPKISTTPFGFVPININRRYRLTTSIKNDNIVVMDKKRKIEDIAGRIFGELRVVKYSHSLPKYGSFWECQCVCGKIITVSRNLLIQNHYTSCGCRKGLKNINDLTGMKFGRLTAMKYLGHSFRECICECGKKAIVKGCDLKDGKAKSCGCLQKENGSIQGSKYGYKNQKTVHKYDWNIMTESGKIKLRSGYEVIYAEYLRRHNIEFEYEPKTFTLNKTCRYRPDFYLPKLDLWVEIKGYYSAVAKDKIQLFQKKTGKKLKIIFWSELKGMLANGESYYLFLKSRRK